MNLNYFSK